MPKRKFCVFITISCLWLKKMRSGLPKVKEHIVIETEKEIGWAHNYETMIET